MKWVFLGLLTSLLMAPAGPASAHGGDFQTVVTGITPSIPGVSATSSSDGEHFTLTSTAAGPLVVMGYLGEPFLRFDATGVWQNRRSPTAYDDSEEPQIPPTDVSSTASPQWVRLGPEHTRTWHDHRTHWMSSVMPTAVQSDPGHSHLIRNWSIPIRYEGKPGSINGTLTYEATSHLGTYLTWGAIGVVVVGFGVVQFVVRPLRRRSQHESGE